MKFLPFLQSQQLLSIATQENGEPWIANVYFGTDDAGMMYFISPEDTKHSQHILKNNTIAFSTSWFDSTNYKNRKAIQGTGTCTIATDDETIGIGVSLHNKNFPEFKEKITIDWIRTNEWGSKVWMIKPNYIKYWDDEIYGDEESEEFHL